jgi:hypothetical protein
MRSIIGLAFVIFPLVGCDLSNGPERPIMNFYRQAKERQHKFDRNQSIALDGLRCNYGVLPGSSGEGTFEQSSLVITDPDPRETQAVQVIVEPRVSGSFSDPAEPSPGFFKEQAQDIEDALKTHRYVAVFLLPKPIDKQAALSNGDKPSN